MKMNPEDEDLQLSASTLSALQSFMAERDAQAKRFEELKTAAGDAHAQGIVTMADFEEDWQQSQFWYDDATAQALAEELLEGVEDGMMIALVSAPSVYVKIREMKATGKITNDIEIRLLEYDQRFALFGDEFVAYDFAQPFKGLPGDLRGKCDRVFVDPPFLSEDCQTKTALTVRWISKPWTNIAAAGSPHVILCTGERMRELVERLYKQAGLRMTGFEVVHRKGLSNEFRCYSSRESGRIKWVDGEER